MHKALAYYRISTQNQFAINQGLYYQQMATRRYAEENAIQLQGEVTEIKSGKDLERPLLASALLLCKDHGYSLVVSCIDRLVRRLTDWLEIINTNVAIIIVDNPEYNLEQIENELMFSEKELAQVSKRSINGLEAAKARGLKLGQKYMLDHRHVQDALNLIKRPENIELPPEIQAKILNDAGMKTALRRSWTKWGIYRLIQDAKRRGLWD